MIAHLWQSTLVAGVVWLITLALRGNRAHVRCWLWKAASLKFLLPFSILVSLGTQFRWQTTAPTARSAVTFVVEQVMAAPVIGPATPVAKTPSASVWPLVLGFVWLVGFVVVLFWWWLGWNRIQSAVRSARPVELDASYDTAGLAVMASPWTFEPGVVGIWRPVLLLPDGLAERLPPTQLNAIIAHERSHIRSYDNVAAAVHMLVEAIFWFHPLVWWMERRLIAERERACDEDVLHAGTDPADYAEGILTVCRFTQGAPVACVAGVSGADLRARIEFIVREELGTRMTFARRVAVALVGAAVIGVPIISGVTTIETSQSAPLAFEVGTIKPTGGSNSGVTGGCRGIDSHYGANDSRSNVPLGRCVITAGRLSHMMSIAFNIPLQNIRGFPEWDGPSRFDLEAKAENPSAATEHQLLLMLQQFLTDQFKLTIRHETKQGDIFVLVVGRGGPKNLVPSETGESVLPTPSGIAFTGCTMARLAEILTTMPTIRRPVKDTTGLQGRFDFKLGFTDKADGIEDSKEALIKWDSVFSDIQQQLGLRLEASKGPIESLAIEHAEKPTVN